LQRRSYAKLITRQRITVESEPYSEELHRVDVVKMYVSEERIAYINRMKNQPAR
jgi:hypothetical protein